MSAVEPLDREIAAEHDRMSAVFGGGWAEPGRFFLERRDGRRYSGLAGRRQRPVWTRGGGIGFDTREHAEAVARGLSLKARVVEVPASC